MKSFTPPEIPQPQRKLCANCPNGNYAEMRDRCRECAEIILEDIRNDQMAEEAEKGAPG